MKKIISLILAVLTIAAMLSAAVIPAFAENLSGDEYLEQALKAKEDGQPEIEIVKFCEQALFAYKNETKTGDEWKTIIKKFRSLGLNDSDLTDFYKKGAAAYCEIAKAMTDDDFAILYYEKAQALAAKSGDTDLSEEIDEALSALNEKHQGNDFPHKVLAKAAEEEVEEAILASSDLLMLVLEKANEIGNFYADPLSYIVLYYELGADYLALHGLNMHAFYVYMLTLSYKYSEELASGESVKSMNDPIYTKFLECGKEAVEGALTNGDPDSAAYDAGVICNTVGSACELFMNDMETADEYYRWEAKIYVDEAEKVLNDGNWRGAVAYYDQAVFSYRNYVKDEEAAAECEARIESIRAEHDPKYSTVNPSGSTLSDGSLAIIVGVACSVVFGVLGFVLGSKKKKNAEEK